MRETRVVERLLGHFNYKTSASAIPLFVLVSLVTISTVLYLVVRSDTYVFAPEDYLPLHTLLELFTITVYVSIFFVRWTSYRYTTDARSLFIGMGVGAIAVIQMMHALTYRGMPDFLGENGVILPTYFWMLSRTAFALVLLVSVFLPHDRAIRGASRLWILGTMLALTVTAIYIISASVGTLPALVVEGVGLTELKVFWEYALIVIFAVTAILFQRQHLRTGDSRYQCIVSVLIISAFEEWMFTLYGSVYDMFNFLGHVLGLGAALVLLRALFLVSVTAPYEALEKERERLEQRVAERTAELKAANEALVSEVAERRRAEQALSLANRKLHILSTVTRHDASNQLSLLLGRLEMARERLVGDDDKAYLDMIEKAAIGIDKLLQFTKSYQDLGLTAPIWQRVDAVVERARNTLSWTEVAFDVDVGGYEVYADMLFEKVFFNLFENSRRHGGHVTKIRVRSVKRPDGLSLIVEDDGIGLPDDVRKRLFQVGNGRHTGYGLYLSKEILSITGADIRALSDTDSGAAFEIFFPADTVRAS